MAGDRAPTYNEQAMREFARRMWGTYEQYRQDRRPKEEQMLKNLRQFNGEWDPETEQLLLASQSRAYPRLTRRAVIGTRARLMEMMFPRTEKNWGLEPSPIPELDTASTQEVLNALMAKKAQEAQTSGVPPADLTDEEIETAITEYAKARAIRMDRRMTDQLTEMDHITLAQQVLFSGILYSYGVAIGPLTKLVRRRTWKRDNGTYKAVELQERAPYYEYASAWDYYPDLAAKTQDKTDGFFLRHIMSIGNLEDMKVRPDYNPEEVEKFLVVNRGGNYVEQWWETELRSGKVSDRQNVTNLTGRKYEVYSWWGLVRAEDLQACGIACASGKSYIANIVGADNYVFKAVLTPYGAYPRPDHVFIYEDTDTSLLGAALPEAMRDSQIVVASAARMMVDNASVVCGPNLEVNMDALDPGTDPTIQAFKVWPRNNDEIPANVPAVRNITIDSHIPELLQIIEKFTQFSEAETMMPPAALGQVKEGSEAYRTTTGANALLSLSSLPIRDTVRNFDKFTKSLVGSLYDYNMEFGPDSDKGDFQVIVRGATSLIARETRTAALDWLTAGLQPDERIHIKKRRVVEEKLRVRDLEPREYMETEDTVRELQAAEQQKQDQALELAREQGRADVRATLSKAFKDVATAQKMGTESNVATFESIVNALQGVLGDATDTQGTGSGAA